MATTTAAKTTAKPAAKADEVKVETAAAAPKNETESQKRNRLRNEAERVVITNHKDEFVQVATELFAANGLTFQRRLTEAEKAEKKIKDLLAEHPELKDALAAQFGPASVVQADSLPTDPFEGDEQGEEARVGE